MIELPTTTATIVAIVIVGGVIVVIAIGAIKPEAQKFIVAVIKALRGEKRS